jgi:hypothetical protein
MITTTVDQIVEFWKERGFSPELRYSCDGISCWNIDVPEDHGDLKHPDYVGMLIQEKMAFPSIIRRRLQPVVYTLKSGKHYAMVEQPGFDCVIPLSRTKHLLQFGFTNPATGECPAIVPLKTTEQVHSVVKRLKNSGARGVMCIVTPEVAETIDIDEALRSLEQPLH